MRLVVVLGCLLLVGCTGPHASGALWAQQNLEQEGALFRLTDAQRADQARAFEHGLADQAIAAERGRIAAELRDCPGSTRQPLAPSSVDRLRDTIRIHIQGDPPRVAALAQVALADWRLRRARASGETRLCDEARDALAGTTGEPSASDVLKQLGTATVARAPQALGTPLASDQSPLVDLSLYASGWTDTLTAQAPLPQYLAAVYGGTLLGTTAPQALLSGRAPENVVDDLASAYPEWEPDALYAALSAS